MFKLDRTNGNADLRVVEKPSRAIERLAHLEASDGQILELLLQLEPRHLQRLDLLTAAAVDRLDVQRGGRRQSERSAAPRVLSRAVDIGD